MRTEGPDGRDARGGACRRRAQAAGSRGAPSLERVPVPIQGDGGRARGPQQGCCSRPCAQSAHRPSWLPSNSIQTTRWAAASTSMTTKSSRRPRTEPNRQPQKHRRRPATEPRGRGRGAPPSARRRPRRASCCVRARACASADHQAASCAVLFFSLFYPAVAAFVRESLPAFARIAGTVRRLRRAPVLHVPLWRPFPLLVLSAIALCQPLRFATPLTNGHATRAPQRCCAAGGALPM